MSQMKIDWSKRKIWTCIEVAQELNISSRKSSAVLKKAVIDGEIYRENPKGYSVMPNGAKCGFDHTWYTYPGPKYKKERKDK